MKRTITMLLALLALLCLTACGGEKTAPEQAEHTCTLSVTCAVVLDNMDKLTPGLESLIPDDGWLLEEVEAAFTPGETVLDVVTRELKERKMHFEFSGGYMEGICNLYEFDCGELSGWRYSVNGRFPGVGCDQYTLSDGDAVCWAYTCDLGADIGMGEEDGQ